MALGVVSYLRNFFSEDAFDPMPYSNGCKDIELKILRNTLETATLVGWISELEKHQGKIHKVVLGVYSISGSKYPNRSIRGESTMYSPASKGVGLIEMYSLDIGQAPDFRAICKAVQKMHSLTGTFSLRVKVYTYGSVDLEGFKVASEVWRIEDGNEVEVSGMKIIHKKARGGAFGGPRSEEPAQPRDTSSGQKQGHKESYAIDCACTINANENDMLQCGECLRWVHAVCSGYFSSKDKRIPRNFTCFGCTGELSKDLRNLCIYRRVLCIAFSEDLSSTKLEERLKITKSLAQKLLFKLRADRFARYSRSTKTHEVIQDREIKEKIKEYFNGPKVECSISVEELECTLP